MYQDVCQCTHKKKDHDNSGCVICLQYTQLRTEKCKAFEQSHRESVCRDCSKYFDNPFGDLSVCGCIRAKNEYFLIAEAEAPVVAVQPETVWNDEEDEAGYIPPVGLYVG